MFFFIVTKYLRKISLYRNLTSGSSKLTTNQIDAVKGGGGTVAQSFKRPMVGTKLREQQKLKICIESL